MTHETQWGVEEIIPWRLRGKVSLTASINHLINDKGGCRTAPATLDLLHINHNNTLGLSQSNCIKHFLIYTVITKVQLYINDVFSQVP